MSSCRATNANLPQSLALGKPGGLDVGRIAKERSAAPGETVEDAVAAYEADGGIVLHRAQNTSEVSVVRKGQFLAAMGEP